MRFFFCFLVVVVMLPSVLFSQTANKLTSKEKKGGWVLLFDGLNSNGWTSISGKPVPAGWGVDNGSITAKKGGQGGDIITVNKYSDFDLYIDYNIEPGCNSGMKYFFTKLNHCKK